MSEWGNPTTGDSSNSMVSKVAMYERTEGTETSKYLEEEKSTEIAIVAASELAIGQTCVLAHGGCRTAIKKDELGEHVGKHDHRG